MPHQLLRQSSPQAYSALELWSQQSGVHVADLVGQVFDLLDAHIQQNGQLSFPLMVQPPSPYCHKCPLKAPRTATSPANILKGTFTA